MPIDNLAYKFMRFGFLSEAGELLKRAQELPNYHDNVASALARLKEIPGEETKDHDNKLKGVDAKSGFLSHVGKHLWLNSANNAPKRMTDLDCEVEFTIEGDNFVATGTFQKSSDALVNALLGTSIPPKTETYTVEYRGRFVGQVAIGERTKKNRQTESIVPSLLSIGIAKPKFIIVMPDGATKVRGMIGAELTDFELSF